MKIDQLRKGLIVSCQAMSDEPMFGSDIMACFADAAERGGAVGLRVNTVPDILAVRNKSHLPVIGILKHDYPDSVCRITPTMREISAVYQTGAEIVALDCSRNPRPNGEKLEDLIPRIRSAFPDLLIMADLCDLEEGLHAWELGVDIVATTCAPGDPGLEFAPPRNDLVKELADRVDIPVIAEGRYFDPEDVVEAFRCGAHNVVIGAAITRPQTITRRIVKAIEDSAIINR